MRLWLQALQLIKDTYIRYNAAQSYKIMQRYPFSTLKKKMKGQRVKNNMH